MTVAARTLWLAAFGAATAWSVDLLAVVAAGSHRCLHATTPVPRFGPLWWVLLAITAAALAFAAWAEWTSARSLRLANGAPAARRVRFMALGGVLLNTVFLIGIGFSMLALFLVPVCL